MSYLPDINNAKVAGTATSVNSGNKDNGTQRVVLATDQPALTNKLLVTPDLPSGASTDASITETHGTKAAGTAATKSDLTGAVYNTAVPAPTNGQQVANQADSAGNLRVNPTGNIGSFTIQSNSPSAGNEAILTVPTGKKWKLRSTGVLLVASAGAANRQVGLKATDASGNEVCHATGTPVTVAGQTRRYIFGPSLAVDAAFVSNNAATGFPEVSLGPGMIIKTSTVNIQVGDVLTMYCNIEEYSD